MRNSQNLKRRLVYLLVLVVVMLLGLGSRLYAEHLPPFVVSHFGDALWAAMIYFGFRFLSLRPGLLLAAFLSLLFCFAIEFSQLFYLKRMKKKSLLSAILIICLTFSVSHAALASAVKPDASGVYRPTIIINGEKQDLLGAVPPSGSTLVPFRAFFKALNIEPSFDNNTKTLTARSGATTITLTAGKRTATLNGEQVQLLQSPAISEDHLYVNLRFIAEAFGGIVQFDKETLTISIEFPE
ncbi:DUF2809 domain-containing protein [Paenibacillus sp. 1P07SE]|uniref:DUF2809 domain-containing protein n=1 Tax=Paenibacillus sp. 1P07SE TaxID=3132209 RepID=UPI0039A49B34